MRRRLFSCALAVLAGIAAPAASVAAATRTPSPLDRGQPVAGRLLPGQRHQPGRTRRRQVCGHRRQAGIRGRSGFQKAHTRSAGARVAGTLDYGFGAASYKWWFGHASDAFGVGWFPWQHLGFALEYSAARLHLDRYYHQGTATLDLDSNGPTLYLRARF